MSTKTKKTKTKATETAKTRKPNATEAPAASPAPVATDAKPAGKKRKVAETTKRLSALDAAATVLKSGAPMNCKELIEAMSAQGLWTSPVGKTPHATLYSAILREITAKGDEARFRKTERGKFAAR